MNWARILTACVLCASLLVFITSVSRNPWSQSNCPAPQRCPLIEGAHEDREDGGVPQTPCPSQSSSESMSGSSIPQFLQKYAFRVFFPRGVDRQNEKYTLIIQTYKRVVVLHKLLVHYCDLERVDKILILWNDLKTPVPESLRSLRCALPLVVIEEKENRMTNRFKPRPEIKTDGRFVVSFSYSGVAGIVCSCSHYMYTYCTVWDRLMQITAGCFCDA